MAESSGTKPPQQERSRKTLEDLLAAGSRLLEERSFDDVTVQDIVAEADSSAGSFYARFTDKKAFLHALQEQMAREMTDRIQHGLGARQPKSIPFDDALCLLLAEGMVWMHNRYRGLIRAVLVQGRVDPELTVKTGDLLVVASEHWARVIDAPGYTFEQVCHEVIAGQRVLLAILDQSLFYDDFAGPAPDGMGSDGDCRRLANIFAAAVDLGKPAREG